MRIGTIKPDTPAQSAAKRLTLNHPRRAAPKGDPAGNGSGNSRNGSYGKSVTTTSGPVRISVPRDRNADFEPRVVAKGQRRVGAVDDMILSLYSRGMTTRDIHAHIAEVYGAEVSRR